jgi:hypothetical protein
MKKRKYLTVLLAVIAMASCNESTSKNTTDAFGESAQVSQTCFDRKMEQWYQSFQEYQSVGYDMTTADEKAVSDALLACESCMAQRAEE